MNAPAHLFVNARRARLAARLLIGAGACALLSACVGNPLKEGAIDPASPVAADVKRLAYSNPDYPSFNEIPVKPADLKPARIYGEEAAALVTQRDQVVAATAPSTWTLSDTQAFADRATAVAGHEAAPTGSAETEAFAADLRKRATPPPPPKR